MTGVPHGLQLVVPKRAGHCCTRELITGSRTNTPEICLMKPQMEAQRSYTDSRRNPNGTCNSAMMR